MILHTRVVDRSLHLSLVTDCVFFCSQKAGSDSLHEVTTLQVDHRVRRSAELTGDSVLLAKLSLCDMVASEAKYHTKCLLALYNHARKAQTVQKQTASKDDEISGIVFAELVTYIEEVCLEATPCQFLNSLIWHNSTCLECNSLES